MNPTEEQKEKLCKLNRKFMWKAFGITFLYISGLFLGNVIISVVNILYVKEESFVPLTTFGSAVIILTGLRSSLEGAYSQLQTEAKKILNSNQ